MSPFKPSMFLIASTSELPPDRVVWGTGGWLDPHLREGLDWLTLGRLIGWETRVAGPEVDDLGSGLDGAFRAIVLACDPGRLSADAVGRLRAALAEEATVLVARPATPGSSLAALQGNPEVGQTMSGVDLQWTGDGPSAVWRCREPITASALEPPKQSRVLATLDGIPVIVATPVSGSLVVTLGFHPSEARDRDGSATALLRHLLIHSSSRPAAWFDWGHTMILRMDDPGGAQNAYSRSWAYAKLGEAEWDDIGRELQRRDASLTVGYISAWVDDGDAHRGSLRVEGRDVARTPGRIHPSPTVWYRDEAGNRPGTVSDYQSEYRGLLRLKDAGLLSVELHGYTHMHPDLETWLASPDRYDNRQWFRELGYRAEPILAELDPADHPLALGTDAIERFFDARPTTLICPGEEFTPAALATALDLGLRLTGSYYLAIRVGQRFCWCQHVCSPYLDQPDPRWFDAGLPVVGYFHDYEPSLEGVTWISRWLDAWQEAGARRFVDYRHVASALAKTLDLESDGESLRLRVGEDTSIPSQVPFRIHLANLPAPHPESIEVVTPRATIEAPLESLDSHLARIEVML